MMHKPAKPKAPRLAASKASTVPTLLKLTAEEKRLLKLVLDAFPNMALEDQEATAGFASASARENPRTRQPALRLIRGGAQ